MEKILIETLPLEHGPTLSLYDVSKKIIGDRWHVILAIRLTIPVKETLAATHYEAIVSVDEIVAKIGREVQFEAKLERFFIDQNDKDDVFYSLRANFNETSRKYVCLPQFAQRFILKKLKE